MQPVEAMSILIAIGDLASKSMGAAVPEAVDDPQTLSQQRLDVAIAVAQAMLNTALPVARFRLFVQIETGRDKGREYTVCSPTIEDIIAALYPVGRIARRIYVTLWEQRPEGADMIEGFQGSTATAAGKQFKLYLEGLKKYSVAGLAN